MSDFHKFFLQERYERHMKDLFKSFLNILENLKNDHDIHFDKLKKNLPEKYSTFIDQADYLDESKMKFLRKTVLDKGNDSMRNQNQDLEKFTVTFDFKK